jgi:hypothetical protein
VARKVLAFNVLSLRDADDVARRVGPNGIVGTARPGDGLLPHLDARRGDDPVEDGGEVVHRKLERTQPLARHPACEGADDGNRGVETWRCEHDIDVGLVVRDERDEASRSTRVVSLATDARTFSTAGRPWGHGAAGSR